MKLQKADWITAPRDMEAAAVTFQKTFSICNKPVKKAVLTASAIGLYVPYLNGVRVGCDVFAPGWTCYEARVQAQTYDVTGLLAAKNVLELRVGQGWAVGYIGVKGCHHAFADRVSAIAQLRVTYADGTVETLGTGEDWETLSNEILSSEIYHGETVDKTAPAVRLGHAIKTAVSATIISQQGEPVREQERLAPVALIHTPKGETVLDFGQNMTGYAEFRIRAPRGSRIVVHHAEVLDKEGNFYNENMRGARNENVYVCSGGDDVFKPTFSFQGFRYVRLTEYPPVPVVLDDIRAVVVHSRMRRTGYFVCGNAKINQLYHNVVWGQKSNYLDVPTDCPQRDERLGWTGDAQVFFRTAAINYDVKRFFTKWLADMAIDQRADGSVAGVIPDVRTRIGEKLTRISAGWGDAACIIPWELYLAYGDKKLLKKHFPMMKKWVEYMHHDGPEEFLWLDGVHYGDWLAMDAGKDSYMGATSTNLIASAFYAYSTSLLVKAGEVLGMDMSAYRALYARVRDAFRAYYMENGMPKTIIFEEQGYKHDPARAMRRAMTQTGLVLILHFGLCDENERPALAAKLVELIRENGGLMSTGFIGTPYLLHALSDNGYADVAYDLLFQEKNPSWLFSVCHGATTMWEHWNSVDENGNFWSTHMNSFNHYAYGAVFDWIFGVACGVKPATPAYREIELAPHPDARLGFAETTYATERGEIFAKWTYKGDVVYYEFRIPAGVTAHLRLPSGHEETLTAGDYCFAE